MTGHQTLKKKTKFNTKELVFDCYDLIEHLSTAFTLMPGDVVPTELQVVYWALKSWLGEQVGLKRAMKSKLNWKK